jgi:predicted amidohydrolase YtcJ
MVLPAVSSAQTQRADLILVGGKIITIDATDRIAQAIAVRGSTIIAVGTDAEILALAGPNTRRVDLRGRTVTPGLIDAHAHFSSSAPTRLVVLDLSYPDVKSIADLVAAVSARARTLPKGTWIEGRGWDEGKLTERRLPTARDLDAVAPDHPVYLTNTTGHYGVANSAALALAGITKTTADPPNGTIDRNADGTPTGVVKESAQGLVTRLVPRRTRDEVERGMVALAKAFNAEGMTAVKDPGVPNAAWESYQRMLASGGLTVRVFALWPGGRSLAEARDLIARRAAMTKPYESTGDDRLIAGGVKLFSDGSGGARTAWMHADWNKNYTATDSGNRGYPASNADTLRQMIRL